MDEIFSYFLLSFCPTTLSFKSLSSVCFGTCLLYYRSSSEISSYLAISSYLRMDHGKATGSPGWEGRVYLLWLYSKVFWLCRFIREHPKSVYLGLISCSEWISQRRFYQFSSWRVICLLVCDLNAKRENKGKGLNTENLNFHITPVFIMVLPLSPSMQWCSMVLRA